MSYTATHRELGVWLDDWELRFFKAPEFPERDTLFELRALAMILRDWISPLNPPGLRSDIDLAWFPGITDHAVDKGGRALAIGDIDEKRIDGTLRSLMQFNDRLRGAFDLVQLQLTEQHRDNDERFQRRIAIGATVILVPAFLAGLAGANTWVPGENRQWGFWALIAAMFVLTAVAATVIWALQRKSAPPGRK